MALAGHWCGCAFFFVAKHEALKGNVSTWPQAAGMYNVYSTNENDGISPSFSLEMHSSISQCYLKSLYWAYITMITTGFGDIVPLSIPETVCCIISMYIGVIITTCTIANLQLLVTNMDAALTSFQNKVELIKIFMRYRRLPISLQKKIVSFYDYQWDLLKGANEEKFLGELPRALQQQVSNCMCRDLVCSLPVLRKANNALLNALTDCVEINIYSPNDDILKPGEQMRGTIIVSRGDVEVLNGDSVERRMMRFDRYAEDTLFFPKVSDRWVTTKTFCEIYLLPTEDFQRIIHAQCERSHIAQMKETTLKISRSTSKANKMFGSAESSVPTKGFQKHAHPTSYFRKLWFGTMFIAVIYYTFAIPLNMMKCVEDVIFPHMTFMLSFGYLVDVIWIVDIIFKSNFFMYTDEGIIVHDKEYIRKNFLANHNLPKEVITALPIDIVALIFGSRYCNILRVTKIVRAFDVFAYLKEAEKLMSEFKFGSQPMRRVLKLNFLMVLVCHWVGCFWYLIAELGEAFNFNTNWKYEDENNTSLSISHSDLGGASGYLRSVYWAIVGMSTVGYGDIIPTNDLETIFSTITILFGGLVLPAIVGGLAAYMGNLNMAVTIHKQKIGKIRSYMRKSHLEFSLIDKVLRFYDYLWSRQGGIDEQGILDELPGPIRQRVAIYVNGGPINSIPFFSSCDEGIKEHLVSLLKPRVFLPNDTIAYEGEVGKEMFLIERGHVKVSSSDKKVTFCTLEEGDFFGESCLLSSTGRTASVFALTYCDCFVLSKNDFNEMLEAYFPSTRKTIMNSIENCVNKKNKTNSSINRNFIEYPKCLRCTGGPEVKKDPEGTGTEFATIRPDSIFRQIWNFIMLIAIVYNAWMIPYRLAFTSQIIKTNFIVDWSFDTFFFLDIYLNYSKFSYVFQGELVTDKDSVKRNYRKKLREDIITVLPLEVMCFFFITDEAKLPLAVSALRIPKLLRLSRLLELSGDVFKALEDTHIFIAPLKLLQLLSGVILIAHWACCGFYAFARFQNDHEQCYDLDTGDTIISWGNEISECMWDDTWVRRQIQNGKLPINGGEPWQLYIRAFHWALPTLVVVVIGDVVPITSNETLYAFLWMVVGVTINATIIGNVANLVANLETESSEFVKKADAINHFMYLHKVPQDLQDRVEHFMTYLWTAHGGTNNEEEFLEDLPSTLQMEITDHTRLKHIKDCPFFDFCSYEIIKALSMRLKPMVFSLGDVMVHDGEMGQEMFFLCKGEVQVISKDGKTVFATLSKGSFFGETSLFFKQKRTSTVSAISVCELFQLQKVDLDNELRQRDVDLNRMLVVITNIAETNKARNTAVSANLDTKNTRNKKLHKLIGPSSLGGTHGKRIKKIFLPDSSFRATWDILCMLFTVYFTFSIPYRASFILDDAVTDTMKYLVIDFIIDVFFMIDVYFRYKCFPVIKNGSVVIDTQEIRQLYQRGRMAIDVISCIPLELLAFVWGQEYTFILRLIHLARVFQLPTYFAMTDHYLNLWNIRISAATSLLFRMFFYYVIVNHWCGCAWFAIHRYMERNIMYTWATVDCPGNFELAGHGCLAVWDGDLGYHNICDGGNMRRCYIRSVYFVITTISTVGYGDIAPVTEIETIWENVVVLIGACIFAGIIGAFTAYLSQIDTSGSTAFRTKLQKLQEYMKYRNLPDDLQTQILAYHQERWNRSQIIDERAVMNILPIPLQMDLSYAVLKRVIFKIPILKSCTAIVRERIAHALNLQVCPSSSTIYNVGDIGWDIYFIGSGLIEVILTTDTSVLDSVGKSNAYRLKQKADSCGLLYRIGNHFGETCLLSQSGVRQETTVARTLCELYLLPKSKLEEIWSYMAIDESRKFRNDLLNRNGNTWHSFDAFNDIDDDFDYEESSIRDFGYGVESQETPLNSPSSSPASSTRSNGSTFVNWSSPKSTRYSVIHSQKNNRRSRLCIPRAEEKVRLKSFSAESAKEAMRLQKNGGRKRSVPRVSSISENSECNEPHTAQSAAIEIQRLVSAGEFTIPQKQKSSIENSDDNS
eukprot:CAMPEP_0194364498 /NCGR_PEP_ID=MMETSP0174-20130528/12409_1 /TAXON_ID=216777 /ORGANISM="Proboscia alata, Strain PI-D3" /LENGTH=2019 /DNA_ID=CAMNT_0039138563 /DNA_START=856 /DNA_END=6918 /DNA_ORIENTATION=-